MFEEYFISSPFSCWLIRSFDRLLAYAMPKRGEQKLRAPQKILLIAPQHMGDVILSTVVLNSIIHSYPHVQIGVVVGSWAQCVIKNHPLISHVHIFDHSRLNRASCSLFKKKVRHLQTFLSVILSIKRSRYDTAIVLSPFFANSAPLAWAASIPQRIGYPTGGFGAMMTKVVPWNQTVGHIADGYFQLLKTLPKFQMISEVEYPQVHLKVRVQHDFGTFIVLHPGAGCSSKHWSIEEWVALIKRLTRRGESIVLTGKGLNDRNYINMILKQTGGESKQIHNACDRYGWEEYLSLLSQAAFLITVDTMSVHAASALRIPTVVISCGGNCWSSLFNSRGPHVRVLLSAGLKGCAGIVAGDVLKAIASLERELLQLESP